MIPENLPYPVASVVEYEGKQYLIDEVSLIVDDHRDRNGLNNCRSNLRFSNASQQCCNRKKLSSNLSGYKGVSFFKPRNTWVARISKEGRRRCLGYYKTPEAAYLAYCRAAAQLHGEFARFE